MTSRSRTARAAAWLLVAAGVLVNAWRGIARPALFVEDGTVLFARHYASLDVGAVFEPYAGYFAPVMNTLAALLCRLPVTWIPTAFAATTALVTFLVCSELLRRGWEPLAPFLHRALAASAIAWLPLRDYAQGVGLHAQQHMLLWVLLLLLLPPAESRLRGWLEALLLAVLAFSHPLTAVLAPVSLAGLALRRGTTKHLAFLVAVVPFAIFGRDGSTPLQPPEVLLRTPDLLARSAFEAWFGTRARDALADLGASWVAVVAGAVLLAAAAFLLVRAWPRLTPALRFAAGGAAAACVLLTASTLLVRPLPVLVDANGTFVPRYDYVQRCVFAAATALVACSLLRPRAAAALVFVWCAVLVPANRRYSAPPDAGPVRAFVRQLEAEERRLGGRSDVRAELPRGEWPIRIVPR